MAFPISYNGKSADNKVLVARCDVAAFMHRAVSHLVRIGERTPAFAYPLVVDADHVTGRGVPRNSGSGRLVVPPPMRGGQGARRRIR